jgi:hypothetical protein
MSTRTSTFVLPFRIHSDVSGSIYIPSASPAQPVQQLNSKRSFPMSRNLSQRIDRILTVVAMCGLLSPLLVGSFMFVVTPH